jgi:hypothetical protein
MWRAGGRVFGALASCAKGLAQLSVMARASAGHLWCRASWLSIPLVSQSADEAAQYFAVITAMTANPSGVGPHADEAMELMKGWRQVDPAHKVGRHGDFAAAS